MLCTLCNTDVGSKNIAVFDCGHSFHLTCVFGHTFKTTCSTCVQDTSSMPDIGMDREIAMDAAVEARIKCRQLTPVSTLSLTEKIVRLVSPLTPRATTFNDHLNHNKKLSFIQNCGFSPVDAVQERIPWHKIHDRYSGTDILEFGFRWKHMTDMNIIPSQINKFTWIQQQHELELDAQKLLSIRMTIVELSEMKFSTHQLVDMGFDWSVLARLGANVETWKCFKFPLQDIKRNWSPTLTQWVSAGFYDKERVIRMGWDVDELLGILPVMSERSKGRMLRLDF